MFVCRRAVLGVTGFGFVYIMCVCVYIYIYINYYVNHIMLFYIIHIYLYNNFPIYIYMCVRVCLCMCVDDVKWHNKIYIIIFLWCLISLIKVSCV